MYAKDLKTIHLRQLEIAKLLYTPERHVENVKDAYEKLTNITCTKHSTHDSIFYIQNCGALGYQAVKFYNDSSDYRIGPYCDSQGEAYTLAITLL